MDKIKATRNVRIKYLGEEFRILRGKKFPNGEEGLRSKYLKEFLKSNAFKRVKTETQATTNQA